MVDPAEIRRWADQRFPSFVEAAFRGESIFPLEMPRFGRANRAESAAEIDRQIRTLLAGSIEIVSPELSQISRARSGLGYSVEMELTCLRVHREQPLPKRVWFESEADLLALIGKTRFWEQFKADVAELGADNPAIGEWARTHSKTLLSRLNPGEGDQLRKALFALGQRPHPGCFAREIPVEGVSGKFLEDRLVLITDILRETKSPAWRPGADPHEQLGLRKTSRMIRMMHLDGNSEDFGLPMNRLAVPPVRVASLLVVENLRTFLTLPKLPDVLALFGEGRAAQTLLGVPWVRDMPLTYWGDLDPNGMSILNALRRQNPQTVSVMMDNATLQSHLNLLSSAAVLPVPKFDLLNSGERAAADFTQKEKAGIEQEKLPTAYVAGELGRGTAH